MKIYYRLYPAMNLHSNMVRLYRRKIIKKYNVLIKNVNGNVESFNFYLIF